MGNRKIIIIFAVIFTCIFSLFYYVLFQMLGAEESSSRVLYLNQVGIFEESANAEKMCDRLREKIWFRIHGKRGSACGRDQYL